MTGEGEQAGRTNYLRGSDPAGWTTGVAAFGKVRCAGVYPGIDLVYHGTEGVLEYDFVLAPGADPGRIALDIEGEDSMEIDGAGDLVLATPAGEVRQNAPRVYQEVAGVRRAVEGRYALRDGGAVGFEVGRYDADRPLVIDPTLVYATYLGGNSRDLPYAVAMDAAGNVYVAGDTFSSDFPTVSPIQGSFLGGGGGGGGTYYASGDAFVTKLDPSGTSVLYSTYVGGSDGDNAFGIAVDASGSAYITGRTASSDFPTTAGAFQAAEPEYYYHGWDAFVCKLAPDGASFVYSTYLGAPSYYGTADFGFAIAVDGSGNAYVTGATWSGNFPITTGAIQTTHGGYCDVFVTKVNPSGSALVYSTFLGGDSNADGGYAIAVDSSGSAVVAGVTGSTNFPTANALQPVKGSNTDGFVARLNAAGSALVYSTFLGGAAGDSCYGLALDAAGIAYVAGQSPFASGFPTTPGAFQETDLGAAGGGFVTKIAADGSALLYSTYLGDAIVSGIAVDGAGNAFVTGFVADSFPFVNPISEAFESTWNGFLVKLNAAGTAPVYSTLLGFGASGQYSPFIGFSVAVDATGLAVVAGNTASTTSQGTPGAFQASPPPGVNGFVVKIHPLAAPAAPSGLAATPTSPSQVDLAWTDGSDEETAYEVERSVAGGAFAPLATLAADATSYADPGREPLRTYAYRVRATNSVGASDFALSGDATTPGTLDLAAVKGTLRDSADEAKDSLKVKGTLAFNAQAADQDFDPAEDDIEVTFGEPADPFVFVVPAGDPGWKAKNGKLSWKSPRGSFPAVKVVLDFAKGGFSLAAKGFDLPGAPAGTVRLSIRCGNDAGLEDAPWTPSPKTPGLLVR